MFVQIRRLAKVISVDDVVLSENKNKQTNKTKNKTDRRSSLRGQERAIANQTNTGTISKTKLGKLLRDGVERIWAFPSAQTLS